MQLDGTLDTFPLRELIEMIVYSSVTGVLELRLGQGVGQLFFYDGRPYHAIAGDEAGQEAVPRLFEMPGAAFHFVAGHTVTDETLWQDPLEMIERAERQAAEWQRIRPLIPSTAWVPTLLSHSNAEHIHINERAWPVLAAVDGQRSVAEVAENLGMTVLDVCVALASLLEQKLIAVRAPRPGFLEPRTAQASSAPQAPPPSSGFFDRVLAQAQAAEGERRPDLTEEEPADQQRSNRYVNNRYIKSG